MFRHASTALPILPFILPFVSPNVYTERICKAKIQNVSTKRIYISYHAEDAIPHGSPREKLISKTFRTFADN